MINLIPVKTKRGIYKGVRCDTENGITYYAIEFWENGKYQDDIATFKVYSDGIAVGMSNEYGVFLETGEETVLEETVKAIEQSELRTDYAYWGA